MKVIGGSRANWVFVASGAALVAIAVIVFLGPLGDAIGQTFFESPCKTPCTESLELREGRYTVFEGTGGAAVTAPQVHVDARDGTSVAVDTARPTQSINRNGVFYVSVAAFQVPKAGTYVVHTMADPGSSIIVAPDLGRVMLEALPALGAGSAGVFVGVWGIVRLIRAARSRDTGRSHPAHHPAG